MDFFGCAYLDRPHINILDNRQIWLHRIYYLHNTD
jgi:hypothetical protein